MAALIAIGFIISLADNKIFSILAQPNSLKHIESNQSLIMKVGVPRVNITTFTYGSITERFPESEEFPVTIYSTSKTNYTFSLLNLPKGVWAEFLPEQFEVGPGNWSTNLLLVGAVKPFVPTPGNITLIILAESPNGIKMEGLLPILQTENLTILKNPGPINFPKKMIFNQDGPSLQTFGVVYAPTDPANAPLTVGLSVIGFIEDGKISQMPSWLRIQFPEESILLRPNHPQFFAVTGDTSSAPIGTQTVVIRETIGNQQFTTDLHISVFKPTRIPLKQ